MAQKILVSVMYYIFFSIAALILILLYRFLPNRKIFIYFCVLMIFVFGVSSFLQYKRNEQQMITREQIEEIREQQQIFAAWYASYQKDIEQLDRNWQLYYNLVETLKTTEIYEYSTYEQLNELEWAAIDEQVKIYNLKIPPELDAESHELLARVIQKTKIYSDAQVKVISSVRIAANPEGVENFDLEALNKKIKDITIREAPAGLFTATEISAIRDKLVVPGEGAVDERL